MFLKKDYILVLSFVVLLNLAGAPFNVGLLRFVALIPLILIFRQGYSFKKESFLVLSSGLLYLLWQYNSILHLAPLDWLGINSIFLSYVIVVVLWLIFSSFLTLSFIPLLLSRYSLYVLPFVWLVAEYSRSWLYSLIVWGDSSSLGDHFSFGFLGYTTSTSESLLALAPTLGVYGLSFFVAAINIFIVILLTKKSIKTYSVFFALIIILIASEFFLLVPKKEVVGTQEVRVAAIQSRNPVQFAYSDEYYSQARANSERAIQDILQKYPDTSVIVLSENSQLIRTIQEEDNVSEQEAKEYLLGTDTERLLIEGVYDPVRNVSLSRFYSNKAPTVEIEKGLLMPIGEYQPYVFRIGAQLLGRGEWFRDLEVQKGTNSVQSEFKTVQTHAGNISAVACSEILSFPIYDQIEEENPDFIVHQQRLAHFHNKSKVFEQILAVSQLRAAITGKYIIGSVDSSGYSHIIGPDGKILEIGDEDTQYVTGVLSI
ncbi:hypothetical protein CL654_00485 [bacterium]|nr:hypothetical protein [bacterium]|tara:strand:+ start:16817 stop:18271 length:1455 start_codon:yes stop_codon:yes gene_type:complete